MIGAKDYLRICSDIWNAIQAGDQTKFQELKDSLDPRTHPVRLCKPSEKLKLHSGWDFSNTKFEKVCFEDGLHFTNSNFKACHFIDCEFPADARILKCRFRDCYFQNGDLRGTFKHCDFRFATFNKPYISEFIFDRCNLVGSSFQRCDLAGASFLYCEGTIGYNKIKLTDVENLRFAKTGRKFEYWLSWEKIKTLGELPLFGVSYIGIIAIWIATIASKMLNSISEAYALPFSEKLKSLASALAPDHLFWTLAALVLVAFASTLYKIFCPDAVKEFSSVNWSIQGQDELEYGTLSHKYPTSRYLAVLCYFLGVPVLLWLILCRIAETIAFFYG